MYEIKKLERYLGVNLLGTGPRLTNKEFTGPRSHKCSDTLPYTTAHLIPLYSLALKIFVQRLHMVHLHIKRCSLISSNILSIFSPDLFLGVLMSECLLPLFLRQHERPITHRITDKIVFVFYHFVDSPAYEFYMPMFRNTLFHLHRWCVFKSSMVYVYTIYGKCLHNLWGVITPSIVCV